MSGKGRRVPGTGFITIYGPDVYGRVRLLTIEVGDGKKEPRRIGPSTRGRKV